jgi:hypothetical protein
MTRQEGLSRAIAEFMEPEPHGIAAMSDRPKFWQIVNESGKWRPRSHREPEVFVMILKAMRRELGWRSTANYIQQAIENAPGDPDEYSIELEDAAALAFVKMNNLAIEATSEIERRETSGGGE